MVTLANFSQARLAEYWDYKRLSSESQVIVIAVPVKQEKLNEKSILPNIYPDTEASGANTTFAILAILKGEVKGKEFVLHHYFLQAGIRINGPRLVGFDINKKFPYLMFLKVEGNNNQFVAISGQTDPEYSIQKLGDTYFPDEYISSILNEEKVPAE